MMKIILLIIILIQIRLRKVYDNINNQENITQLLNELNLEDKNIQRNE